MLLVNPDESPTGLSEALFDSVTCDRGEWHVRGVESQCPGLDRPVFAGVLDGRSRREAELAFAVQPNRVPVLVAGRSLP